MMGLFRGKSVNVSDDEILKEGWLSKESKYRKLWREYVKYIII